MAFDSKRAAVRRARPIGIVGHNHANTEGSNRMLDDLHFVALCKEGQLDAFGELIRRYENRLFFPLYQILQNAEDARDALQDAFLLAYQSLNGFEGRCDFYTWLYRIGVNTALTYKRKRRRACSLNTRLDGKSHDPVDASRASEPSHALTCAEQSTMVRNALRRLGKNDRALLVLKDMDGLRYQEVADLLKVPIGTVRSRLHRARLKLWKLLQKNGDVG
jgi:RNA polymerase sigma-70 factor (ECF subfamily)